MASSNTITDLMPRIVSRGLLRFREHAILPRLVNNSLSAEAARHGDAIRVPVSEAVAVRDVTPAHQPQQAPVTALSTVTVPLDNWKSAAFYLTDAEMMQIEAQAGFIPLQMAEAITALANAVNQSVLAEIEDSTNVIGRPGETPFQTVDSPTRSWHGTRTAIQARKMLNMAAAPKTGRFAIIDYEMEANALGLPAFQEAQQAGSASVPLDGEIGRKFGIDWFSSDLLPHKRADLLTTAAASQIDAEATEAELKTAPSTIRIGDVVTTTQRGDTAEYQITAITAAHSGAHSTVTVTPAFAAQINANAALKVRRPYRIGVAMHRDAVALAMRPLTSAGMESGATGQMMSVSDPETGLSLRLEVTRQYKQTMWEFDILWGVKLVRPELVVAIHG